METRELSREQVLERVIPWETYMIDKLIDETGLQLLRKYDHRPQNVQAALLDENGVAYIRVFLGILCGITKEETLEYVVALIEEMLSAANPKWARLFHDESFTYEDIYQPFLRLLGKKNWFIQERSCKILTHIISARPNSKEEREGVNGATSFRQAVDDVLTGLVDWLWNELRQPNHTSRGIAAAVSSLATLLREPYVSKLFVLADGVKILAPLITPASSQQYIQVLEWIDYSSTLSVGASFEKACAYIDSYLTLRTFLVGNNLSIADISILAGLAASGQRWNNMRKGTKFPHLARWYNSIVNQNEIILDIFSEFINKRGLGRTDGIVNKDLDKDVVKAEKEKLEGSFDIELHDAEVGKVCTRFPPEPSGYLHIGHVKAALLNQYFAQKYNGRLILRFDDTNPSKEKNEFVESIIADLETLGLKWDVMTYTSDYFPELMKIAEKLIHEGKAYVDDTPREEMRKERMDGVESKCRNLTIEENMVLWKEMIAGSERGKQCCLRGKLDMQAANKSLRDPVYYRCNPVPHHRVGQEYNIYPTYDFACPYVDSIEGVTHALRSSEYHDRQDQYYKVLEDMGLRKVHMWDFSRLNMTFTLLSKRKLQWFVDNGKVDGWDDPRFPTVRGILRRGLTVEALRQFILSQGASKNLNLMEWDKLWTINKKIIDPICPRHTAVLKDGRVLFLLKNGPDKPFVRIIPRHKKFDGAGKKATTFTKQILLDAADAAVVSEGEEVTLMDWGNAIVETVQKDENGTVVGLVGVLHLEGSVKTTKLKLTWLPDIAELVNLSLIELDYLITKKKLEEEDDFTSVLNPVTRWEIHALGDANMRNLKRGEIIQLERKGYYICDAPLLRPSKPICLIAIPDGRQRPPPGEFARKMIPG